MFMSTITINLDEETEKLFRKNAILKFGKRKGSLSKALTEAIHKWSVEQIDLHKTMELMDKAKDRGGVLYESRDELYLRD